MIPVPPPQGQPIPPQGMPQGQPQQAAGSPPVTIDAVMQLLRDGAQRRFRIDIETDSTITGDESQERQDRSQFIETTTKFIEAWGPIIAARPELTPMAGELLLFGVRAFRVGRSLEEVVEETVDKLEEIAKQPKPPPQPSPDELEKTKQAQIKTGAEGQKAQASIQETALKTQGDQKAHEMEMFSKFLDFQHQQAEHHMQAGQMAAEDALAAKEHERKLELGDQKHKQAMAAARKPKGND